MAVSTIYVVDEIVFHSRVHPNRIGSLHKWLLHGDATRGPGGVCTTYEGRVTCEDVDLPQLYVTRSGRFFPPLFSPGVHLVLREDVLRQIDSASRMFFPKHVVVKECIDFYVEKSHATDVGFESLEDLNQFFPKNFPTMKVDPIPGYFEIRMPFIDPEEVEQPESCVWANGIVMEPWQPFDKPLAIAIPRDMLNDDLLMINGEVKVMSRRIFEVLDPFLDRDFYRVKEVVVDV